jgi:YHS domain-containing protein
MFRFILLLILLLILFYVLRLLIKDMLSPKKKVNRSSEPEELVQDPYCKTYIPKRSAVRKKMAGRFYYFCDQECMKKYLRREK